MRYQSIGYQLLTIGPDFCATPPIPPRPRTHTSWILLLRASGSSSTPYTNVSRGPTWSMRRVRMWSMARLVDIGRDHIHMMSGKMLHVIFPLPSSSLQSAADLCLKIFATILNISGLFIPFPYLVRTLGFGSPVSFGNRLKLTINPELQPLTFVHTPCLIVWFNLLDSECANSNILY